MVTTQSEMGRNRTGIATSPKLTEEMIAGVNEFSPSPVGGDESVIAKIREDYARDAEPLGSVPPPMSVKGVAKAALRGVKGERPTQFVDKLGERLAFERTGVRLYEALISKFDVSGGFDGGPTRAELEQIQREEYEHFRMLVEAVEQTGGDPTVVTPSADLHATMSSGILAVMVDPRTSFAQCLEAALLAELADNAAWEALAELASQGGDDALAQRFLAAQQEEVLHLANVKAWLAAAQGRSVP